MQRKMVLALWLLVAVVQTACGGDDATAKDQGGSGSGDAGDGNGANTVDAVDDLPKVPKITDPAIEEYEAGEAIIPAGEEVLNCYYLPPLEADKYVSALKSYQGKFGHHFVLFQAVKRYEPGTVRTCNTAADMASMRPIISSVNFGLSEFPEGMAIRVPAGAQMVLQQHYVNTSDHAVRTRDVMHLTTMNKEDVKLLAGFYGLANVDFKIEPGAKDFSVNFECKTPRAMNLLLMGPHMHEWGTSITTDVEVDGVMDNVISIPKWEPWFRDMPPVKEWTVDKPMVLSEGAMLRTECKFSNSGEKALEFPHEMCATYGYYFPAPEGSEAWTCDGK
jgi:hypothetical protein